MSNIALLTNSHNAIAAKKRARKDQIKEILFDDDARRDFLTGFHKRKLAKAEAAREKAKARAKQERLDARREQRQMLREKAKENAAQVEQAYGAVIEDDEESWDGINGDDTARDDEYEDEEQLATVTVVEDFDPDTIIHGPEQAESSTAPRTTAAPPPSELPPSSRRAAKKTQPKVREKKIRYETKDARRREQTKQRMRRTEKAERAGGKASRKSNSGPGKGSKKTSSGGGKRRHPSRH